MTNTTCDKCGKSVSSDAWSIEKIALTAYRGRREKQSAMPMDLCIVCGHELIKMLKGWFGAYWYESNQ